MRYTRRRRASACYNGLEYERVQFRKNCPCAEEDYECDYGYERSSDSGPCVAIMAVSHAAPTDCNGFYTVSNGYRLVAGDTCDPKTGVDHLPTQYRCPGYFGSSAGEVSSSGWFVLLLLLLLLAALGVVTMSKRSERLRDLLRTLGLGHLPGFMPNVRYQGLGGAAPDSAADDELDLGVDDEEAEELHDDVYGYERAHRRPLSSLPAVSRDADVPRLSRPAEGAETGSLLGEEFTSPLASNKKAD